MSWTAEDVLAHSAKGTSWSKKDHKYVKKVGNKYYYKDDLYGEESYEENRKDAEMNEQFLRNVGKDRQKYIVGMTGRRSTSDMYNVGNTDGGEVQIAEQMYAGMKKTIADVAKKYGLTGMPSNVANLMSKVADKSYKEALDWNKLRKQYAM